MNAENPTGRFAELAGRVALVTGGGRGIGRGIATALLAEGASVAIAQRSPLDAELAADDRVHHVAADLTDAAAPPAVVADVTGALGGLDVLVNCAGLMFERDPADITLAEWDAMIALNLRAPLFLTQAAIPYLTGGGSIINIGSIEGRGANPGHAAYSSTKAGVHGLTKALAVDLGDRGIRCNAIAPGWISTELSDAYLASSDDAETARQELLRLHPAGRLGEPSDIGAAAVFLASDRSSFITGEVLVVDGGRTAKLPTPR